MTKYIAYTKEKGKIETDKGDDFNSLTWHRLDGPAYQEFHDNGKLAVEVYYINDKQHRLDGPSMRHFNNTGKLKYESYYINGKPHRLDGPAYQRFWNNGQLDYAEYWINSTFYTKTEYDVEIFKMKLALL